MGSTYFPKDGCITYENEFIALFKKPGKSKRPTGEDKENSRLTKAERSLYFRGLWKIPGARQDSLAAYPLEIPYRLIKMFSFSGETVLDPFIGGGTTLEACQNLGRRCVGIEISREREQEIICRSGKVSLIT